jgi:prepilin-type N-terminal cleavage/methylation domain-containing protein
MRTSGFTLTELMMSMAIMGTAGVLLMPALNQAKTAALQSGSIANIRQIGVGALVYSVDSDDRYPTAFQYPMMEGMNEGGNWPVGSVDLTVNQYLKSEAVWFSPLDTGSRWPVTWGWYHHGEYRNRGAKRSYQFVGNLSTGVAYQDPNTGIGESLDPSHPYAIMAGRSTSAFEAPSATIILAEAWHPHVSQSNWDGAKWEEGDWNYLGNAPSAVLMRCDSWLFHGRTVIGNEPRPECASHFLTVPAPGVDGRGRYAFADGSARTIEYQRLVARDLESFKVTGRN